MPTTTQNKVKVVNKTDIEKAKLDDAIRRDEISWFRNLCRKYPDILRDEYRKIRRETA